MYFSNSISDLAWSVIASIIYISETYIQQYFEHEWLLWWFDYLFNDLYTKQKSSYLHSRMIRSQIWTDNYYHKSQNHAHFEAQFNSAYAPFWASTISVKVFRKEVISFWCNDLNLNWLLPELNTMEPLLWGHPFCIRKMAFQEGWFLVRCRNQYIYV